MNAPSPTAASPRALMRRRLLAQREAFAADAAASSAAGDALTRHLRDVLSALEPQLLGLYWPHRCEFNAAAALLADPIVATTRLALPYSERPTIRLHYRTWDGAAPRARDDCGLATADGPEVVPDVVLVPCVGFTAAGHRLGYGGGYFDRWLAAHPGVTSIGVAWAFSRLDQAEAEFAPQPHDQRLTLIVTEAGVV
ncbi:MAG TPA: 5-formyltetrahydrofolate cyclo-ligase [Burkholderiaceae bacterium]|nr:5-formyltetrahydrofolate cyclo-ligase [Burkholderiaceae bacterium]